MALFVMAMAFFLVSGESSTSIQDHCTDISYYDVVKYETSTKQCCETKLHQVCTTKSDQVCQDVLELQCDVVAWGECISTPTNTPGTKCSVKFNDFAHQNCEEVTTSVAHTKKMPECKEITKNNCVTDWEVDSNGNKVWAGTETCAPVTWEECEIVEKTVEFPSVKTECHVDSLIKWAEFIDATTNIVGLESKCEVKKAVNCKNIVVNKCAPVVWQECKMVPREECLAKVIHTPSQEKILQKKCLTNPEPPGGTTTAPTVSPTTMAATTAAAAATTAAATTTQEIRVSVDGRLTTSPLPLGSRATVTCQSTGGQILTLFKNQEQLGSPQQYQTSHTFTVVQDDHGAVLRCKAQDQTLAEHTLQVHLPCSEWTWNNWTDCNQTCGSCGRGFKTRNRTSHKNGIFTGCEVEQLQWCPNPIVDCPPEPCSEWQWTDWTSCSVSCGNGVQTRQRKVDTCRKFKGCEVERIELKGCTEEDCPIRCDGKKDCCNSSNPCGLDDGHCDEDSDCKPGLVCGDPENPEANRCTRPKGFCSGGVCIPNLPNEETRPPVDSGVKLKSNIIPYFFTNTTREDKDLYRDVMDEIEKETKYFFQEEKVLAKCEIIRCLEIETKSETKTNCNCRGNVYDLPNSADRVLFISETQVNDQEDCKSQCQGFIRHELMHVLGMGHTFTRLDRDDYIKVILDNVDLRLQDLFTICEEEHCPLDDDFPYDCDSIMHYGTHSPNGVQWMEPINETCKLQEKQKINASEGDWRLLKKISEEAWSAEIAANRRCTEHNHNHNTNTTTYNWYDDKWPAKNHTAESCKALCQQDPTCPQADFYFWKKDDRGDCYVYTTSTGAGVSVGGCAVVGCSPKEIYFKCEEEQGIIQSVRALGGLMQRMSFELFNIVNGSIELTENEKSLIDQMKKSTNYFKSCHTQNRCNSKEISEFGEDLYSKYLVIDKISRIFWTSFIKEKDNLWTSLFTSEFFLKPFKACTTTCEDHQHCVGDKCLEKCQVTDLENLGSGYNWIRLDDCYCDVNGGGVCPKQSMSSCQGGNFCEIHYGCMTNKCPNAEGLTPPIPSVDGVIPWDLILG